MNWDVVAELWRADHASKASAIINAWVAKLEKYIDATQLIPSSRIAEILPEGVSISEPIGGPFAAEFRRRISGMAMIRWDAKQRRELGAVALENAVTDLVKACQRAGLPVDNAGARFMIRLQWREE